MAQGGDVAKRAFKAMMEMRKIDVAKIEGRRARRSLTSTMAGSRAGRSIQNNRKTMLDHVFISVSDIKRSVAFYSAALKPLGITTASTTTASMDRRAIPT